MNKRILTIGIGLILVLTVLLILSRPLLSLNKPKKASVLIIEGWLPTCALEQMASMVHINDYDHVLITGMRYPSSSGITEKKQKNFKSLFLGIGGAWIKHNTIKNLQKLDTIKTFQVYARGTEAAGRFAHYSVFINDSLVGESYTQNKSSGTTINLHFPAIKIHSILIYFDNDLVANDQDRNLWIDSICVNKLCLKGNDPLQRLGETEIRKHFLGFRSESSRAAFFLKSIEINKGLVVLDTLYTGRNRTRAYARLCKIWLLNHNAGKRVAINIVSFDYHSRRTYQTYKAMGIDSDPGIYSMPYLEVEDEPSNLRLLKTIRHIYKEYISLALNWFYQNE